MKKIIYFALIMAIGLVLSSTTAFAAEFGRTAASLVANNASQGVTFGTTNSTQVNVSKGVAIRYFGAATAYTCGTLHMNGDREFGTTNISATLWWDYGTNGANTANATGQEPTLGAGSATLIPADWSSL